MREAELILADVGLLAVWLLAIWASPLGGAQLAGFAIGFVAATIVHLLPSLVASSAALVW
jgi:hypothetical protein